MTLTWYSCLITISRMGLYLSVPAWMKKLETPPPSRSPSGAIILQLCNDAACLHATHMQLQLSSCSRLRRSLIERKWKWYLKDASPHVINIRDFKPSKESLIKWVQKWSKSEKICNKCKWFTADFGRRSNCCLLIAAMHMSFQVS